MSTFKDLNRLLNGLSLIAKEIANRSPILDSARNGDVPSLIQSTAKNALVSVTNISGLTKGSRRRISPGSVNPRVPESVVYFDHEGISQVDQNQEVSVVSCDSVPSDSVKTVETERNSSCDSVISSPEVVETEGKEKIAESAGNYVEVIEGEREVTQPQAEQVADADAAAAATEVKRRRPRERRVPSTPFSRAIGFAGLGAGLAWGTLQESARRLVYGAPKEQQTQSALSPFLNEKNAERLALALCRMRGAALKIGQMLSIQDESLVPAPILAALDMVRQGADVMPRKQLNQVLDAELGPNWQSKLSSFDYEPMAAASIGQVHRAVTREGLQVAMKIQYPGVADSIDSDIENVKLILDYTKLIPEGLYLDRAMKVAKQELSRECDYELEAKNQKRFRDLLSGVEGFYVPVVLDNLSSKRVLTTELVSGIPIDKVALLNQDTRNYVGTKLLEITLMELFVFRFMQTDPNWSNFLYDEAAKSFNLIDFGAARDFPKIFVDNYLRMVIACANGDTDAIIEMSQKLGFLTGRESEVMLDAHVQAGLVVGLPFSKPGGFDFRTTNITQSISNLGATMLRHRLTPPPDEAYSLHRKLSGAFLACMKLGSVVPCRELLLEVHEHYHFGDGGDGKTAGVASTGLLSKEKILH